jgi:DNA modification methylase
VIKPYYDDGGGRVIYHGDCREILPQISGPDAVVSDPPYGISFDTDYTRFTSGFDVERTTHKPVANDDKPFDPSPWLNYKFVILWGMNCYSNRLPLGSLLVWDKRFANGKAFLADAEVAWFNKGHGVYIYSETAQGCIRNDAIQHPTQKPVGLMKWCLNKIPKANHILDPFMGSGTTIRAAKDMGLKAIGIELEEKYCEIAAKRLEQEVFNFESEVSA